MVQHNLIQSPQRVWYMGPMFRYERPQKAAASISSIGRRGVWDPTPDLDAELLLMCRQWWKRLGIDDVLTLELNTIGSSDARQQYKSALSITYAATLTRSMRIVSVVSIRILCAFLIANPRLRRPCWQTHRSCQAFWMMSHERTTIGCVNYSLLLVSVTWQIQIWCAA